MEKNKKVTKKIIGGILAATMLFSVVGLASAEESRQPNIKEGLKIRRDLKDDKITLKDMAFREAEIDKVIEIVEEYAPETLEEWNNLKEEHKEIKNNFKDNNKDKIEELKQFIENVIEKLSAEELTKKEALQQIKEKRSEIRAQVAERIKNYKNENPDKVEALKEMVKEKLKVKVELAKAILEEEEDKIKDNLNQLYDILKLSNEKILVYQENQN